MSTALPHDDLHGIRDLLGQLVGALDGAEPEDAAGLELAALGIQAPFAVPDAPPDLARELPHALHERGDPLACDLLAAIERLAPQPLAGFASEARARLEAAGVRPALAGEVGAAALMEASVLVAPDGDAEIWYAVLGRPGSEQLQPVVVFVENEPCGAVVVGATLGVPDEPEPVRGLLRDLAPDDRPAEPLDAAELTRRLRSALAHMERHEVPLDKEAASVLPLLERALTGHAGGLPRPFVALVDEAGPLDDEAGVLDDDEAGALDDDERAEAELRDAADDLTEAFAAALEEAGSPLAEHGPFVAHCMLDWKIGYADGALLRWTLGDLRELLLDWFPRKVTADDETIAVGVDAVAAFLRFLAGEELLDAPVPLASLEAAVERLRPRFEAACRDPRNWGLAKSMFAGMSADGVDPGDPEAVQDWIADFNARSREERDVILGPAMDRISAPGRAPAPKRAKRKAAKRARKRNRR